MYLEILSHVDVAVTTINILAAVGKFSFYVFLVLSIFVVLKILPA